MVEVILDLGGLKSGNTYIVRGSEDADWENKATIGPLPYSAIPLRLLSSIPEIVKKSTDH
jgi:hypothetical protein